jgi:signal transduction histidine kinase
VFDQVREISHGIHPAILSERGLTPALKALARRSAVPVELDLRTGRRLPDHVEVAAYYAVSEALANAAKHARASAVHIELDTPDATLRLAIRDDGIGGADPARGIRADRAPRPHRGARRHVRRDQPGQRRHHAAHRDPRLART